MQSVITTCLFHDSFQCNKKQNQLFCGITCKWVLFPIIDLYFYQLAQIVGKYIIDSFLRAQSRLRQKLNVYVFQLAKKPHSLQTFCFSLCFLFACAAINRVNLAFRTTIIKDTHLTLAVISFKVKANNSLIFFAIINRREKFCGVSVPLQSLIPCLNYYAGYKRQTHLIKKIQISQDADIP